MERKCDPAGHTISMSWLTDVPVFWHFVRNRARREYRATV